MLLVCPKCDDLNDPTRESCESCGAILGLGLGLVSEETKQAARRVFAAALANGTLKRGQCERRRLGGCEGPIHGHHEDYSKPLYVRWLCRKHHLDAHYPERVQRKAAA